MEATIFPKLLPTMPQLLGLCARATRWPRALRLSKRMMASLERRDLTQIQMLTLRGALSLTPWQKFY